MNPRALLISLLTISLLGTLPASLHAAPTTNDWPQWRGPDRSNASRETGLLKEWPPEGPPLVWRATGIGLGIHSVSIADGRVFTVGNREGGEFLFALDAVNGEKLWATRLDESVEEHRYMRWLTQRTPTVDGNRVYAFSVRGNLFCMEAATGNKLWQISYTNAFGARQLFFGLCDHPLVDGDRLICSPFSTNAVIAALNKHTGEVVWKTPLEDSVRPGYAALVRSEAAGIPQIILFHGKGLAGFAASDGRLLWNYERPNTRTASSYTPLVQGNLVLSPNGYGGGLVLFELSRDGANFKAQTLFATSLNLHPLQDSTAAVRDHVYLVERGNLACVELKSASKVWGRTTEEARPQAALTWADGHVYLRNVRGQVKLVEVSPQGSKETGFFQIPEFEESVGVTSPVVSNGRLWLRDNNRLFCYDITENSAGPTPTEPRHVAIGLTDRELAVAPSTSLEPRTGVNRAPDAVFVPTPQDIVERMLVEVGLKNTDTFIDLGSGDGRFVIAAAKTHGCKAIGYEIDERLVTQSREAITNVNLGSLASIEYADIFTLDLSHADVVAVFLYPRLLERLVPQFEKLKPGSRIISHQFAIPGIKPDRELAIPSKEDGDTHRIFLWTTPLKKDIR